MSQAEHIHWFRSAAPYINAFRGKTFVIVISGEMLRSALFEHLIHDIALCHHLGIRLLLVHGSREQIDDRLREAGIESRFHRNMRISEKSAMPVILQAIHEARSSIEARLSMGLPNTPMSGADISVISGNFVTGMPLGVIDGVDMQYSGKPRSVDCEALRELLPKHIPLLSPLGYSRSGELFNLPSEELAAEVAIQLGAEKLIYFNRDYIRRDHSDQFSTAECLELIAAGEAGDSLKPLLGHAVHAVQQGVERVHIIDSTLDGGLLQELFTREGAGMMITNRFYEGLRQASIDDIGGILELIQPLERAGALIPRSREQLELDIEHFLVIEKDGMIVGCIACIPDPDSRMGEIACLAVHPDYRKAGFGEQLLAAAEEQARKAGLARLYILTTRTSHWFLERGFEPASLDLLPPGRQRRYNEQRKSIVMSKLVER